MIWVLRTILTKRKMRYNLDDCNETDFIGKASDLPSSTAGDRCLKSRNMTSEDSKPQRREVPNECCAIPRHLRAK